MLRPVFAVTGLAIFLAGSRLAATDWFLIPIAESYVQQAWAANPGLQRHLLEVTAAEAEASMSGAARGPRIDLVGRYSVASGGRTIEVPSGDLLNPAYAALNRLLTAAGEPASFPAVSNQQILLLRPREQETKLRLTLPLYNDALKHDQRARQAAVGAATASHAAAKRGLRRLVLESYYLYLTLHAAERIWAEAVETTAEALRASRVLYEVDRVTEDQVLRSEADDLAARQGLIEATHAVEAARFAFNVLLHRPVDTEIGRPKPEAIATLVEGFTSMVLPVPPPPEHREELAAWHARVEAASAAESAARSRGRPSLALVAEGGIQGTSYRTSSGADYGIASVVGEINLWDGRERRATLALARVRRHQAELGRDELREHLIVETRTALHAFQAAREALPAAARRAAAARRSLQIVTARQDEGLVNQLAFLDARQTETAAALEHAVARLRLLVAGARLDQALGASPLE